MNGSRLLRCWLRDKRENKVFNAPLGVLKYNFSRLYLDGVTHRRSPIFIERREPYCQATQAVLPSLALKRFKRSFSP